MVLCHERAVGNANIFQPGHDEIAALLALLQSCCLSWGTRSSTCPRGEGAETPAGAASPGDRAGMHLLRQSGKPPLTF